MWLLDWYSHGFYGASDGEGSGGGGRQMVWDRDAKLTVRPVVWKHSAVAEHGDFSPGGWLGDREADLCGRRTLHRGEQRAAALRESNLASVS